MNNEGHIRSILAGIVIGIGGFAYLSVGGVMGAILFSFGLLLVFLYGLFLFTGLAGAVPVRKVGGLLAVLAGNMVGAVLIALCARISPLPLSAKAGEILLTHLNMGPWKCGIFAILCGFIVEACIYGTKSGTIVPTFVGVPIFILCGFPHCVADIFFYALAPMDIIKSNIWEILLLFVLVVAGNFIGCNIRRWCITTKTSDNNEQQ